MWMREDDSIAEIVWMTTQQSIDSQTWTCHTQGKGDTFHSISFCGISRLSPFCSECEKNKRPHCTRMRNEAATNWTSVGRLILTLSRTFHTTRALPSDGSLRFSKNENGCGSTIRCGTMLRIVTQLAARSLPLAAAPPMAINFNSKYINCIKIQLICSSFCIWNSFVKISSQFDSSPSSPV